MKKNILSYITTILSWIAKLLVALPKRSQEKHSPSKTEIEDLIFIAVSDEKSITKRFEPELHENNDLKVIVISNKEATTKQFEPELPLASLPKRSQEKHSPSKTEIEDLIFIAVSDEKSITKRFEPELHENNDLKVIVRTLYFG